MGSVLKKASKLADSWQGKIIERKRLKSRKVSSTE
jgi:hypothetical protein